MAMTYALPSTSPRSGLTKKDETLGLTNSINEYLFDTKLSFHDIAVDLYSICRMDSSHEIFGKASGVKMT